MFETLFTKVMLLVVLSLGVSAFGIYVGRFIRSLAAIIVLGITFLVGSFAVYLLETSVSPGVGVAMLLAWVFVSGLFLGPTFQLFAEDNGWQTIFVIFTGTMGVMAVFGGIGLFSGIDFSGMGMFLGIALFGLIIAGVVGIFVRFSREVNIVYSIIGMVVFSGYFIFDFFRLGHTENTWGHASQLTMHIYLDIVNFMLYAMQLYEATKHH